MFETKIALVVRDDLVVWQKLNVTAFLMSGIVGTVPGIVGEPYVDAAGNRYSSLTVQPVIVLAADQPTLTTIHRRALERGVETALYIEEMFATGHDAANRALRAVTAASLGLMAGVLAELAPHRQPQQIALQLAGSIAAQSTALSQIFGAGAAFSVLAMAGLLVRHRRLQPA